MQYKYATEQIDYSDFTSGRVFYSLPGHPAFPVRLASEIFLRCLAHRERFYGTSALCSLYDPCCGAAYHLSVLAFLHGERLRAVTASDIDEKAVALAGKNLDLLTMHGMEKRISQISRLYAEFNKDSHKAALQSGHVLKERLAALARQHPITAAVFQADARDREAMVENIKPETIDIVFTDVPYGQHSRWRGSPIDEGASPLWSMLAALLDVLSSTSILAIVSDKGQKAAHPGYQRVEQFQVGKRRVTILKPV